VQLLLLEDEVNTPNPVQQTLVRHPILSPVQRTAAPSTLERVEALSLPKRIVKQVKPEKSFPLVKFDEKGTDEEEFLIMAKKKPFVQTNVSCEFTYKHGSTLLNDYHTIKHDNLKTSMKVFKPSKQESTHQRNLPPQY